MSADKRLPPRMDEKGNWSNRTLCDRWEELEGRMLMSRGLLPAGALDAIAPPDDPPAVVATEPMLDLGTSNDTALSSPAEPGRDAAAALSRDAATDDLTSVQTETVPTEAATESTPARSGDSRTSSEMTDATVPAESTTKVATAPTTGTRGTASSDRTILDSSSNATDSTSDQQVSEGAREQISPQLKPERRQETTRPSSADSDSDAATPPSDDAKPPSNDADTNSRPTPTRQTTTPTKENADTTPVTKPSNDDSQSTSDTSTEPVATQPRVALRRVTVSSVEPDDTPRSDSEPPKESGVTPAGTSDQAVDRQPTSDTKPVEPPTSQEVTPVTGVDSETTTTQRPRPKLVGPAATAETEGCDHERESRETASPCGAVQLALVVPTTTSENATYETSDARGDSVTEQAVAFVSAPESGPQPLSEFWAPPDKSRSTSSEDVVAELPNGLLAESLTDSFTAPAPATTDLESHAQTLAAGAFAVALSKPLSRFVAPTAGPLDGANSPLFPFGLMRRKRKGCGKSSVGTKDDPDEENRDDEPDESGRFRRPENLPQSLASVESRSSIAQIYEPFEQSIGSLLDSFGGDSSIETPTPNGVLHHARTIAAGALAAATAFFTLHGRHTTPRQRPQLRPARPEYVGPTALAANQ